MLNGIYNDSINNYISRESNIIQISDAQKKYASSPFAKTHFVDETQISSEAMKLYEHENDVKKFTALALSDEDDTSHMKLMQTAFDNGIKSPFTDDLLDMLLDNQKFLSDISE